MKKQKNVNFSPSMVLYAEILFFLLFWCCFHSIKCALVYDITVMGKCLYLMKQKVGNPNKN